MTSSDITLILSEFKDKIENYSIDNIYELNEIIVIRVKGFAREFQRQASLVIEPGKRIHMSDYQRSFPEVPSDKILNLRRFLKKGKISRCFQLGSDRIVVFEIYQPDTNRKFSLYLELFGKGNLVLVEHLEVDGKPFNKVLFALWYKIMRDRRLLPGKEFIFPPIRGKSFLEIEKKDLLDIPESELEDQIVKVLVKNFGSSGEVIEEILALADVDKKTKANIILPTDADKIILGIKLFKEQKETGKPVILFEKEIDEFGYTFLPFPYKSLTGEKTEKFETFNETADQFFSPTELLESGEAEKVEENKIKQLTKQLNKQEEHLIELRKDSDQKKAMGDKIFLYANSLDGLFTTIKSANKKGMSWEEITERLNLGKSKGLESAKIFLELDYTTKTLKVDLDNEIFLLDFTKSPYVLGNVFYEASKKAERKIIPAMEAIEITKEAIKEAEDLKYQAEIISKAKAVKKRVKRWYEAYHWTRTPNGFLVIAGRNLKENEQIAKRRMEEKDIFFHADVQGAPYTILKYTENDQEQEQEATEIKPDVSDFKDAATFAGIYSKAWKAGLGFVDVYSATPDQLSFSAPAGEYLPKGSIFVEGKRTFYKVELKLFIGITFDDTYAYLFATGNEKVIKQRTSVYTTVNASSHGDSKKSETAKKIQHYFEKNVPEESIPKLKTLTLNDYVLILP
jgi:predicted ribosome quality control (RQC) complex YloA/Tae2 family protein